MHVHGEHDRHISRRIREQGIWEPYETSLLLSLLRPDDVFVDVGANIGYFSLIAATLVGAAGAVFAFEPDPANYSLLRDNARLNGCDELLSAVQAGLAAEAGEGRLYLSEDNLGDHQIFAADGARSSLAVNLLNGSQYLQQRLPGGRTPRVDVLKVDVQGAEYAVMQGLMPLLRSLLSPPCSACSLQWRFLSSSMPPTWVAAFSMPPAPTRGSSCKRAGFGCICGAESSWTRS